MNNVKGLTDHGYLNGLIINARDRHVGDYKSRRVIGQQAFKELVQISRGNSDMKLTPRQMESVRKAINYRGCTIPKCPNKHYAKGWCEKHWKRNKVHGSPFFRSVRVVIDERIAHKIGG